MPPKRSRRGFSLDHLIRPLQERRRDRQPESLGGPEVDDEFEVRRLLDGQIRRLGHGVFPIIAAALRSEAMSGALGWLLGSSVALAMWLLLLWAERSYYDRQRRKDDRPGKRRRTRHSV
jgi:hypothetical protein